MDKQSGKDFNRRQYKRVFRRLKENGLLIIKSIDRLGRNYDEIIEQRRQITKVKKADILVIDMPLLDTRREKNLLFSFLSDIVLQVLSFAAENERDNIKQRKAEGITAAKAKCIKFGRLQRQLTENFYEVHKRRRNKKLILKEAAAECGMPLTTFFNKAEQFEKFVSE